MAKRSVILCCVIALISIFLLPPQGILAKGEEKSKVPETDEEIEKEFMDWVSRMGEKHKNKLDVKTITGLKFSMLRETVIPNERVIVVDKRGKGDFKTIKSAIKAIPNNSKVRYIIKVLAGTYKERVKIPKGKGPITLQGSANHKTKITYKLDAQKAGGTLRSATVSVKSDNFIAKDIAFENTSPSPVAGAVGQQAVALEISGDKAAFYRCAFLGYQDTLYDRQGRHYFKDCYIRGTIDFIFGNGQSYYESCQIAAVTKTFGSVAAQKRMTQKEDTGFSFVDCTVRGTGYIYLSRAWGPYSRVVFIRTYFDSIIRPEAWYDWGIPGREKTVFYGEYKCYGPGANRRGRVAWSYALTDAMVKPFLTVNWIDGKEWLPRGRQ